MKIVVCAKQVPDTTEVKLDPKTNTLIRDGVPSIINPDDKSGIEAALKIKEQVGGTVTVVCMGPPQADAALREALAMGCDEAILVTDRAFGGADTWATSNAIAAGIKKIGEYDIIFAGRQAIDGDTGQVGPEMGQHLGIPQVTYAVAADIKDGELQVRRETEDGWEVIGITMPAIITVNKTEHEPRMATLRSRMAANRAVIEELHCADVAEMDMERVGLKGSPTKVNKSFVPDRTKHGVKIADKSAEEAAAELVGLLTDKHLIS